MVGSTRSEILDLMGGEAGCRRLCFAFYARVAESSVLRPLFPGKSLRCAAEELSSFLVMFLDGDPAAMQYRWWLSLGESHGRFRISEAAREEWLRLMSLTLAELASPVVHRLEPLFEGVALYVSGSGAPELSDAELAWRWGRQQTLDELVSAVRMGDSGRAIKLAGCHGFGETAWVGILAMFMSSGHADLVGFTASSTLPLEGAFNGRSLMHHAAGGGCLPVVSRLLAAGCRVDVADRGGHRALYRAASCPRGAEVVRALVAAGADVDHAGGVMRATALHEAARFGCVEVVAELLALGANRDVLDRRGKRPIDRARDAGVIRLLE